MIFRIASFVVKRVCEEVIKLLILKILLDFIISRAAIVFLVVCAGIQTYANVIEDLAVVATGYCHVSVLIGTLKVFFKVDTMNLRIQIVGWTMTKRKLIGVFKLLFKLIMFVNSLHPDVSVSWVKLQAIHTDCQPKS